MNDVKDNTLLKHWASGERKRDIAQLNVLLSNHFLAVGPRGFVLTKQQWLERFEHQEYSAFDLSEPRLISSQNTVVIVAKLSQTGTFQGHNADGVFRISQTWVETPDGWKLLLLHYTADNTQLPIEK
ncbi:nuclear transport factor 2 family protein [Mucilaginibacter sp. HD30]